MRLFTLISLMLATMFLSLACGSSKEQKAEPSAAKLSGVEDADATPALASGEETKRNKEKPEIGDNEGGGECEAIEVSSVEADRDSFNLTEALGNELLPLLASGAKTSETSSKQLDAFIAAYARWMPMINRSNSEYTRQGAIKSYYGRFLEPRKQILGSYGLSNENKAPSAKDFLQIRQQLASLLLEQKAFSQDFGPARVEEILEVIFATTEVSKQFLVNRVAMASLPGVLQGQSKLAELATCQDYIDNGMGHRSIVNAKGEVEIKPYLRASTEDSQDFLAQRVVDYQDFHKAAKIHSLCSVTELESLEDILDGYRYLQKRLSYSPVDES